MLRAESLLKDPKDLMMTILNQMKATASSPVSGRHQSPVVTSQRSDLSPNHLPTYPGPLPFLSSLNPLGQFMLAHPRSSALEVTPLSIAIRGLSGITRGGDSVSVRRLRASQTRSKQKEATKKAFAHRASIRTRFAIAIQLSSGSELVDAWEISLSRGTADRRARIRYRTGANRVPGDRSPDSST
eukprot:gene31829-7036_t